jgi:hypothetical protein
MLFDDLFVLPVGVFDLADFTVLIADSKGTG